MGTTVRPHPVAWVWVILFLVAVVARFGASAALTGLNAPPVSGSDEAEYDAIAWNILQGKGYVGVSPDVRDATGVDREHVTAYRPPVTPVVFAAVYAVAGHSFAAIRIGDAVIGGLATLLVSVIAARVFTASAGWIAGVTYAVYPIALYYNTQLLSETHASFLLLLVVRCGLSISGPSGGWWAVATGVSLGLLVLCKPGYIFLFPFLLVWAWAVGRWEWRFWRRAILVPCLVAVFLGPWVLRNQAAFGALTLGTGGGSLFLQANNRVVVADPLFHGYAVWDTCLPEYADSIREPNDELKRDAVAKAHGLAWVKANPQFWFYLGRGKVWRLYTPEYFGVERGWLAVVNYFTYLPILILAGCACVPFTVRWVRQRDPALILFAPIVATTLIAAVFHGQHRYRYPIDGLLIVLAAGGVVELGTAVADWWRGTGPLPLPRMTGRNMLVGGVALAGVVGWVLACRADNARIDAWRAETANQRVAAIRNAVTRYRTATGNLPTDLAVLVADYLPNAESLHSPTHTLSYQDYQLLGAADRAASAKISSYRIEVAPEAEGGFRIVQFSGLPGR